ncbi:hypothetical protein KP509_10G070900 [Ceratopteris richardii]|uniref:Peptidase A2 domain-containing protein n=1 Tax=Ceratopteris richardii TaxID=49495 RepID=A0A8T2U381_CERRI|nr:hypothetical protein KP509_10G070900 [Ceratopteris richardii]
MRFGHTEFAYKTVLNATPFQMVFGQNAVLPLDFLIPALKVAQEHEWNGHELASRIFDLERLGETRLRAAAGIYAAKKRQKAYFDAHVKDKGLKEGDLVLVYTLKQHARKLEKRGYGPMIINRLSTSGAVQLATLEGDILPNYISGCRVKLYQEPLTEEMLMRLNTAKKRKEEELRVREEAQAEARERIRRNKLRRLGLDINIKAPKYHMDMCQKSGITTSQIIDRRPFVTIEVGQGKSVTTVRALVDSGAATSAVRLSYYQDLQLDIKPIEAYLIGLGGVETPCLGEVELPIYLQDVPIKVKMLVCHDEDLTEPLVLGQDWIYDHAVNLNLRSQLLHVWAHEQCITLELENRMPTDTDTTHSPCFSKANLLEQDVVDVKSSMIQKDAITEGQSQRQDEPSFSKSKASTLVQPQKQTKQCKIASLSNRQRAFKKKEVMGMKQIWVKKGVQPSMLPQRLPPNQIDHDNRRTKHP